MKPVFQMFVIAFALSGCREVKVNPEPLVRLCKQWGGVPLVVPDSRYQPGTIVDVSGSVAAFVDNLQVCDVPYIQVKKVWLPGQDPDSGAPLISDSEEVSFKWDEQLEYDAKALAEMPGIVSIKAGLNDVEKTTLDAQGLFGRSLRRSYAAALVEQGLVDDRCRELTSKPQHRVIGEVLVASRTKATFQRRNGAKVDISGATVGDYLELDPSVTAVDRVSGTVELKSQFPFCVRILRKGSLVTGVLGSAEAEQGPYDIETQNRLSREFATMMGVGK